MHILIQIVPGAYGATGPGQYVERVRPSTSYMSQGGIPIPPPQQQNTSQQHQQPSILENLINSPHFGSPTPSSRHLNGSGNQGVADLPLGNTEQQHEQASFFAVLKKFTLVCAFVYLCVYVCGVCTCVCYFMLTCFCAYKMGLWICN